MARVLRLDQITPQHYEIVLERQGLVYESGQWTLLIHEDRVSSRPYSFASSPQNSQEVSFYFRNLGDGFSRWLTERRPGDEVSLGVPAGSFRPGWEKPEIWVAVGTGIAPFLSVGRGGHFQPRLLVYGVRNEQEAHPFSQGFPRCLVTSAHAEERDRLAGYRKVLPLESKAHYFLCGIPSVVQGLVHWLKENGIEGTRIHKESYA